MSRIHTDPRFDEGAWESPCRTLPPSAEDIARARAAVDAVTAKWGCRDAEGIWRPHTTKGE